MSTTNSDLLTVRPYRLGAHTSTQGGLHKALEEGKSIGATTVQLFTRNQRQWKSAPLRQEELEIWQHVLAITGMTQLMSHASYLINLGSNREALLMQSRIAFAEEIKRCLALQISYLNFHPGAATGASEADCLDRIVQSLTGLEDLFQGVTTLRLLIETTAGQGSTLGYAFDQLAYIINRVKGIIPIGVCIDTCHIFAAGYDIRTLDGWKQVLAQFDALVGLEHLYALHVNDSLSPFGSRKDRHANLGEGTIGMAAFEAMMQHPNLRSLPKYLETPNGPPSWAREIKYLNQLYDQGS